MPSPGAGGVQTSLVGTVQGMMASARGVPPHAGTRPEQLALFTRRDAAMFSGQQSKFSIKNVRVSLADPKNGATTSGRTGIRSISQLVPAHAGYRKRS